jgi:hypothetical protein
MRRSTPRRRACRGGATRGPRSWSSSAPFRCTCCCRVSWRSSRHGDRSAGSPGTGRRSHCWPRRAASSGCGSSTGLHCTSRAGSSSVAHSSAGTPSAGSSPAARPRRPRSPSACCAAQASTWAKRPRQWRRRPHCRSGPGWHCPLLALPAIVGGAPVDRSLATSAYLGAVVVALLIGAGVLSFAFDRPLASAGRALQWVPNGTIRRRRKIGDVPRRLLDERDFVRATIGRRWQAPFSLPLVPRVSTSLRCFWSFGPLAPSRDLRSSCWPTPALGFSR